MKIAPLVHNSPFATQTMPFRPPRSCQQASETMPVAMTMEKHAGSRVARGKISLRAEVASGGST